MLINTPGNVRCVTVESNVFLCTINYSCESKYVFGLSERVSDANGH